MNLKRSMLTLGATIMLTASTAIAQTGATKAYNDGINIIPMPQQLTEQQGRFTLTASTTIGAKSKEAKAVAQYFAEKMAASSCPGISSSGITVT